MSTFAEFKTKRGFRFISSMPPQFLEKTLPFLELAEEMLENLDQKEEPPSANSCEELAGKLRTLWLSGGFSGLRYLDRLYAASILAEALTLLVASKQPRIAINTLLHQIRAELVEFIAGAGTPDLKISPNKPNAKRHIHALSRKRHHGNFGMPCGHGFQAEPVP